MGVRIVACTKHDIYALEPCTTADMTDITRLQLLPYLALSPSPSRPLRAVLDYVKSRARAQSKDFSNAEQAARVPPCALPKTKKREYPHPHPQPKLKLKPIPLLPCSL